MSQQPDTSSPGQDAPLPLPRLRETPFATPTSSVALLTDEDLHTATGVRICFTNRLGGVSPKPFDALNLSAEVGDIAAAVRMNRRLVLEGSGASVMMDSLIVPHQVHGTHVVTVHDVAAARDEAEAGADAVVCAKRDVPVLLTFADCVPVVLVAPNGAFCVAHSGWRGTLEGIAGEALGALAREAGCDASQCNVYIGPHIRSCCYEVDAQLLASFVQRYGPQCDAGGSHLDMRAAVILSLLDAGANSRRILDSGLCTSCQSQRYFSYRVSGGKTGRQGALAFREERTWD